VHQQRGLCNPQVGARFEIPGKMEWVHMMIDPKQNTPENGYGRNVRVVWVFFSSVLLVALP